MTRENKLALVVGFGLILFVGILISDHFSIVRHQKVADLTKANDPDQFAARPVDTRLIDLTPQTQPTQRAATPAVAPTTMENGVTRIIDPVRPEQRTTINPDGFNDPPRLVMEPGATLTPPPFANVPSEPPAIQVAGNETSPTPAANVKSHDVRRGETLYAICRQHYGDTNLVAALAQYNKMDNPANLRVGRRLMIPPAEELGGRTTTASAANAAPRTPVTYTVRPGDNLAQIAQRFLGSKNKWKKLHEMNRDVIDDPDNIKVGTVIRVL